MLQDSKIISQEPFKPVSKIGIEIILDHCQEELRQAFKCDLRLNYKTYVEGKLEKYCREFEKIDKSFKKDNSIDYEIVTSFKRNE